MFAPPIASAQTKTTASRAGGPVPQRSTQPARGATPGISWDYGKIPTFPPNEASQRQTPLTLTLPTLKIGRIDDPLEREADSIADRFTPSPDSKLSSAVAPTRISRMSAAHQQPAVIDHMIRSSGEPLAPSIRDFYEPHFGLDLDGVRIHADSMAASAAQSLGAAAFTIGLDIAFAPGRFQPHSHAGQRLLAHELAHVVQQNGGAPGIAQAAPFGIQRAVDTLGGEWDTDPGKYKVVKDAAGADIGVEIDRLHFKPKDPVDASKIGLTQMVNSIDSGNPIALNPTVQSRSIPAGQTDAGSHIDRLAERSNPIYGMNDPTDTPPTLGGSVTAGNSQWGFHYNLNLLGFNIPLHQDATLYDQPTLPGHGPNSSQIFETSALAVEGKQAGTFYGSVRWGWRSDAKNKLTIEPLSVVSVGVPSATFKASAALWNAGKTSSGGDTVDLPIAAGSANAQLPSQMTDAQITARLTQITAELAAAPAGQRTESLNFEKQALEKEQRFRQIRDYPDPVRTPDPTKNPPSMVA